MYGSATARSLPTGKKQRIADLISQIIETLDLTKTQYANIESAYNGVDTFLSEGGDSLLQDAVIYPQGSVRRRTHPRDFGRPQQHCAQFRPPL
ncbi:hypothetical protein [Serratia ureilytica]|uniref:hypothetical protein n=1 Tax=Serratia ureilytica TaxID=300181 RepID=UPI001E5E89D3|nr:hypothetical protein [Serratia ureilytica]